MACLGFPGRIHSTHRPRYSSLWDDLLLLDASAPCRRACAVVATGVAPVIRFCAPCRRACAFLAALYRIAGVPHIKCLAAVLGHFLPTTIYRQGSDGTPISWRQLSRRLPILERADITV